MSNSRWGGRSRPLSLGGGGKFTRGGGRNYFLELEKREGESKLGGVCLGTAIPKTLVGGKKMDLCRGSGKAKGTTYPVLESIPEKITWKEKS